jgi:hypothetical protein
MPGSASKLTRGQQTIRFSDSASRTSQSIPSVSPLAEQAEHVAARSAGALLVVFRDGHVHAAGRTDEERRFSAHPLERRGRRPRYWGSQPAQVLTDRRLAKRPARIRSLAVFLRPFQ